LVQENELSEEGGSGLDFGSGMEEVKVGVMRSQIEARKIPKGRSGRKGSLQSGAALHKGTGAVGQRSSGGSTDGAPAGRQKRMRGLFGAAMGGL
jgi:hypothetical protein